MAMPLIGARRLGDEERRRRVQRRREFRSAVGSPATNGRLPD